MLDGYTQWPEERAAFYREKGCWAGYSIGDLLRRKAAQYPNAIALKAFGEQRTYAQLVKRSEQLAAGFQRLGIQKEERVVVQLPNTIAYVETIFALFFIGALPVFALPSHRFNEISYFCQFSEAVAYIGPTTYQEFHYDGMIEKVKEVSPTLKHIILNGETSHVSLEQLYRHESFEKVDVRGSDVAFLQLSGGTTGLSKLIPRTHDEYIYTLKKSVEICHVTEETRFLVVLPVAHNYPMSSPGILGVFYAGGTVVMSDTPSADEAFPLIEREKITMVALVPPIVIQWLFARKFRTENIQSLDVMLVGGAKLSEELARKVMPTFGCTLQQVFGMAEGLVNYTRLDDSEERIVRTQGKPMSPFDEIKVVDSEDRELPLNTEGFLLTRGPYTIQGYYKAEEHNKKSFTKDGFYRTGDLVRIDEKGYITVTGRDKDQINRGGEKIAAEEVENHLLAHEGVFDVAVVAMPDAFLGEKICAFVIKHHEELEKRSLLTYLESKGLATYKIPDRIEWIEEFPETALGKVNKKQLRNIIQEKVGV